MFPSLNAAIAAAAVLVAARDQLMCVHATRTVGVHVKSALALMCVRFAKMDLLHDRMHPQLAQMAPLQLLTVGVDQDFPPALQPLHRPGGGRGTDAHRLRFFCCRALQCKMSARDLKEHGYLNLFFLLR
jgi:hypothetical protein